MDNQKTISEEELAKSKQIIENITAYYKSKMVGQEFLGTALLISMISNGHILLESVPGLAKTTAAKVMTEAVAGSFSRIQCTPDLIPSDIVGTQTYHAGTHTFETKLGPVNANFVLLDEVNRSSAKTQSAMLEAMQEHAVSIGGTSYAMPEVFVVIATQNPIEQEGTYILSEAQMDRFLLKVDLDYPNEKDELEILNRMEADVFSKSAAVASIDDIIFLQKLVKNVYMDTVVKEYIVSIVQATRHAKDFLPKDFEEYVEMGASTRAAIAFMDAAKAMALISGRSYCSPDDVKAVAHAVLRHRIMLSYAALADGIEPEQIIDAIIGAIVTP